ncbi:MAG TPA: DNA-directed RNA polymerase subunit delta [Bacillales bacterium]|nr:DNA-directed RNA polymerase subunit delta [Bacillales bacterium]
MGSNALKQEELRELSMVDLAFEILKTEKQPLPLQEMINRIVETKKFADGEVEEQISRFYTNLNLDGRFIFIGENHWGLKNWYPFDQTKDDIEIPTPKRKKKKKVEDEDDYVDEFEDDEDYLDEDEDFDDYEEDEDEADYDDEEEDDEEEEAEGEDEDFEYDEKD